MHKWASQLHGFWHHTYDCETRATLQQAGAAGAAGDSFEPGSWKWTQIGLNCTKHGHKSCGIGCAIEWSEENLRGSWCPCLRFLGKKHLCFIHRAIFSFISALWIVLPLRSDDRCIISAEKTSLANTHDVRNSFLRGERLCPASWRLNLPWSNVSYCHIVTIQRLDRILRKHCRLTSGKMPKWGSAKTLVSEELHCFNLQADTHLRSGKCFWTPHALWCTFSWQVSALSLQELMLVQLSTFTHMLHMHSSVHFTHGSIHTHPECKKETLQKPHVFSFRILSY